MGRQTPANVTNCEQPTDFVEVTSTRAPNRLSVANLTRMRSWLGGARRGFPNGSVLATTSFGKSAAHGTPAAGHPARRYACGFGPEKHPTLLGSAGSAGERLRPAKERGVDPSRSMEWSDTSPKLRRAPGGRIGVLQRASPFA